MLFVEKPPYYSCPSGKIGLLSSMYVVKEYRRRGIANLLLDKVVNEAKEYGCATVQITASDMGVLLYTDYGFKKNNDFEKRLFCVDCKHLKYCGISKFIVSFCNVKG